MPPPVKGNVPISVISVAPFVWARWHIAKNAKLLRPVRGPQSYLLSNTLSILELHFRFI